MTRLLAAVLAGVTLGLGCLSEDARVETSYEDFLGSIVEVVLADASEAFVVIESDGRPIPIRADPRTRVLVSGVVVPLDELPRHLGAEVRVICQTRGGKRGDTWVIEVRPGPRRKPVRSG